MFEFGDHVIVFDGSGYAITRNGSYGVIVKLYPECADVRFDRTTGDDNDHKGQTFPIELKKLRKLTKLERALK